MLRTVVQRVARRSVLAALAASSVSSSFRPGPTAAYAKRAGSTAAASVGASPSAVNVEEFTLNDDVVQRDLANMAKWNELSETLDAARAAGDHSALLTHVGKGLAMLEEIGVQNAPIQCETLLCMEASQAHYNLGSFAEALTSAERAKKALMDGKPEQRDMAQISEIDQFIGFVLCKQGKPTEAHEVFQKVLHWIDVDAKSAMPMQAVAAVNLRRSTLTGVGESLALQAEQQAAAGNGDDHRELFGKALDILIEALNQHIDENDFQLVKTTLQSILKCFEGINDTEQAVTTCRKYISWCSRHEDTAGAEEGKTMLASLCAKHNIPNPLDSEGEEK